MESLTNTQLQKQLNKLQNETDFLPKVPRYLTSLAPRLLLVCFVTIIAMAFIVKMPEKVECKVYLTTENPPIRVMAPLSGRIEQIVRSENSSVAENEVIAVIENTAHWRDVLALEQYLVKFTIQNYGSAVPKNLKLGSLQTLYSTFTQNANDFDYWLRKQT